MPLLNIIGITNIGTTFNIGFALILLKEQEAYIFLAKALDKARIKASIPLPKVS